MRKLAGLTFALCILGAGTPAHAQDATRGEIAFKRICAACHSTQLEGRRLLLGPTLFGIVNRPSGSVTGFRYSAANQKADLVWTPEILDKYLTNPKEMVPGTIMTYAGSKNAQERADIIAYLQTLK